MLARKIILGAVAVFIVGLLLVGQSLSQPGQRGQRPGMQGRQAQGPGGRQFDPERMRQMMEQRIQQQLGATDQEWRVLGPCVMKVSELRRELSGFGRGGMFGGMFGGGRRGGPQGDRPGGRQGAPAREQTEVEKALEQLRTLLENTSATSGEIKKQLTAVRAAKEKAKQKLVVAQQELRKMVTLRQEGQLMLMGMLD
jgi:hypothetical protein